MVFQSYALFPHLTARENVSFGLEMRRVSKVERQRRVESMLDRVGLSVAERGRCPAQLSGGQQQRVALARALVIEPNLLLLDEPFTNLDRSLREQLRGELKALQRRSGVTALLVTHDRDEALTLADRVGVLASGRLLQVGTPDEVYERPCCPFVAHLLGDANLFRVEAIEPEQVRLDGGLSIPNSLEEERPSSESPSPPWGERGWGEGAGVSPGRTPSPPTPLPPRGRGEQTHRSHWRVGARLLARPERCRLSVGDEPGGASWLGQVIASNYLGCDWIVDVAVNANRSVRVRQRAGTTPAISVGTRVTVTIPREAFWLIPEADPDWLPSPGKDATHALP
jgi:ABC-type Fe3+/spermidine/putrescine transport system ATPase subunit